MRLFIILAALSSVAGAASAQCVSKQLTFVDGSRACMEHFEPLVIGGEGQNIAEQAEKTKTHAYAITSPESTCPASSAWAWDGANDDARAIGSCARIANQKSNRTDCRCIALVPVSGKVEMTQSKFVTALFKNSYGIIEQVRSRSPSLSSSLDKLKSGLEERERVHYDRLENLPK